MGMMNGRMDFYVCDPEGNIVGGPFETEQDAKDWLFNHSTIDGFIMTTGACDVGE